MLRGCGLFHCVLGGYVERLWSLSLCFGLWSLSLEVVLKGCGLFHCVMGGYVERLWPLSLCLGGYVERLWPLSLCFGRLC